MGARKLDPTRLDVAALAAEGVSLSGQWTASDLDRWCAMQTPAAGAAPAPVQWSVRGEQRRAVGRPPQVWLHLHAKTIAWPTCQRCLRPFSQDLVVDRAVRFVDSEAQAEALDADSEEDVLALEPTLDLRALVEDELLLAWPIVPRHASCEVPDHRAGDDEVPGANPFATLASLKPPAGGC
jgi:DUF177 domain-containing protein